MAFSVESFETSNGAVLRMHGRFVEKSTDTGILGILDEMIAKGVDKFVVNLHKVEYLNSSGINILVQLVTRVNHIKGNLIFTEVPVRVADLLEVMKLNAVFQILATEAEAKSLLNI